MRESRLTNGNQIAISLTALSIIQIGMAEVWDRKGSTPNVGQDRQAHYLLSLTTAALPPDGSGVACRSLGVVGGGSVARKSAV